MKGNPEATNGGIAIELTNPQPEVRKNAESANDWEYKEEASYLYRLAVLMRDRLVDPLHRLDRARLPEPVLAFENLRNKNTLAAFRLTRSPEGLQNEIIMNTEHYIDQEGKKVWEYGKWAQLETLLHEQVHEWQQVFGKNPVSLRRIYHNKEFVEKCESLGLHSKLNEGYHLRIADGPFAILMKELGISAPDTSEKPIDEKLDWYKWLLDFEGRGRKGTSTLSKWVCPDCNLKIRVGIKSDPQIVHEPCSIKRGETVYFVKAENINNQMNPNTEYKLKTKS